MAKFIMLLASMSFLAAACEEKQQFTGQCQKNGDCPTGFACRADGLCACRSDEACADGEFCNTQGLCQTRSACRSNVECDATKYCDNATGDCIDRTACGTDVHCVPGTVCDTVNDRCIDGCYSTPDCPLYSVCEKTSTASTALGRCLQGKCDDKSFCAYRSKCVNDSCTRDANPNHCATCSNQPTDCGSPRNYCLINASYVPGNPATGSEFFCGVECAREEDCPNGYDCGAIVLLTQDQCTGDGECGGSGRQCAIGEGQLRGFCTCVADADCTLDTVPPLCLKTCGGLGIIPCQVDGECSTRCLPSECFAPQGRACTQDAQCEAGSLCGPFGPGGSLACATDGSPCTVGADCLCNAGSCFGTNRPCTRAQDCRLTCQGGGCLLGAACAPTQGLLCPDVQ